jgi:hypothetical protein
MTLLSTSGSSDEAPIVTRRRVYMNELGDMVRWERELRQPMIHAENRTCFNAVDVHKRLELGPHSLCTVGANHLHLKIFLALVAIAETNAYLTYADLKKLTSAQYSHGDFKTDLGRCLLKCAATMGGGAGEGPGRVLRSAERGVAGGGA